MFKVSGEEYFVRRYIMQLLARSKKCKGMGISRPQ